MPDFTIFYSWQMDAPERINKQFIHQALNAAVQELGNDFNVEPADRITVDQGMKGVPGSPEIATMMFEKIGESAIYVGDISLVGEVRRGKAVLKRVPNPNVNIEEGFAAGVLGWERVICVANTYYGSSEEQSVDQRNRRYPISYHLKPRAHKTTLTAVSTELKKALKTAIDTVKTYELRRATATLGELDIRTIELVYHYRNGLEFYQPVAADPQGAIPALQNLDLWNRCLIRVLGLGLARTELGIDAQLQPRYSYRWTILGKKIAELITKRFTPAPPV
jgi:hypothetical protein